MKKLLLASVAALAVTAFAAGQAVAAEANDGLRLGLGGYHSVHGAFTDQDDDTVVPAVGGTTAFAGTRDFDIFSYGEINFWAEKTFDNGLTVGYKSVMPVVPVATAPVDNIEENFVYFSGYWGRIVAGQDYSPLYYMTMGAPVVDPGIEGIEPDFNFVNIVSTAFTAATIDESTVGLGNFNTVGFRPFEKTGGELGDKIAYYTPRFSGFQFGASYTPEFNRTNNGVKTALGGQTSDSTFFQQSERIEVAGNYEGSFWNGVGLKAGGGYGHANLEAVDTVGGANTGNEDQDAWNAGAHFSYLGWTFGGGYLFDDNGQNYTAGALSADGETDAWNAGVTYDWGPWRAGVSYLNKQTEVIRTSGNTVVSDDEFERWVVAGAYKVAPGVDLGATVQFHDYDTAANTTPNVTGNNEATVVTVGTTVNF